jgi:hypothetical protein
MGCSRPATVREWVSYVGDNDGEFQIHIVELGPVSTEAMSYGNLKTRFSSQGE